MPKIVRIISGGQSGADRAGLDFAIESGVEYGGFVCKGGKAEDYPPGSLLRLYPNLTELPTSDYRDRTRKNVETADLTLVFSPFPSSASLSPGTRLTMNYLRQFNKAGVLLEDILNEESFETNVKIITKLVSCLPGDIVVNVAGTRESKAKGTYFAVKRLLSSSLSEFL